MQQFYTVKEICDSLKVRPNTVRTWIRIGKLKAIRLHGNFRIPEESLAELLEEMYGEQASVGGRRDNWTRSQQR